MIAQFFRQAGRAVAIYFSDILLWMSLAGVAEILAVIAAGLLCILTAGFFFEGMKKHPVVLLLGGLVALTGTFLMFRELRGMFWPEAAAIVVPAPAPAPQPGPEPKKSDPPSTTSELPKWSQMPGGFLCSGLSQATCKELPAACTWLVISNKCVAKIVLPMPPLPSQGGLTKPAPATVPPSFSLCVAYSKDLCSADSSCYWSALTNRCEKLRVGGGLLSESKPVEVPPAFTSCWSKLSESTCRSMVGCTWSSGVCLYAVTGQK